MDLSHTFTVPATVEETWKAFEDIESVAGCFPGATVTEVSGDDFKGSCKVKLGPIALVYSGQGTFVEKDEAARRFVIEAKGKDKRGNGTAGATVTATFADEGDATKVDVVTDLAITGKPAQFGRGVIQDVSEKLLQQFVTCLQSKVGTSPSASAVESPPATSSPPASTPASAPASTPASASASTPSSAPGSDSGSSEPAASAVTETEMPPAPSEPAPGASPGARKAPSSTYSGASTGSPQASSVGRGSDDALDLGATVLPVLARTYWKQAAGGLVVLAVLWWLVRKLF